MSTPRGSFGSKTGMIAAAAGSAVGLGNIWRFPYIVGENGGAAFIMVYLMIIFLVGLPILMSEFTLGRNTRKNVFGAFRQLSPGTKWPAIGILGIFTAFIILSFYNVVAGWTLAFLQASITNSFSGLTPTEIATKFDTFVASGWEPILWTAIFIFICANIVILGVEKGIERYNKILMPMLFIILIGLGINSLTLEGMGKAMNFLFTPDFSKIDTGVVLNAMGQAFFSLSLGMGTMMTYGSYMRKKDNMLFTSASVVVSDILVAVLAGIAIFPAVFSFGIEPSSGPDLVFKALPNIFVKMTGGYFISILFFLLLVVAALTSAVSVFEVIVSYCTEELKFSRKKSVWGIAGMVLLTGTLCSVSQMADSGLKIGNYNVFDLFDTGSSVYLLPIGGFLIVLYTGWVFKSKTLRTELASNGLYKVRYYPYFRFIIKYIAPIMIMMVFLSALGIV